MVHHRCVVKKAFFFLLGTDSKPLQSRARSLVMAGTLQFEWRSVPSSRNPVKAERTLSSPMLCNQAVLKDSRGSNRQGILSMHRSHAIANWLTHYTQARLS